MIDGHLSYTRISTTLTGMTEWQGKIDFLWGPELMPYGLYEFGIRDPDGYHLSFAERRARSP
jgi:hypothetical protein